MKLPSIAVRLLSTGTVVVVALIAVGFLYSRYVERPWTRNGQVQADIVQITPRVGGLVVRVPVKDNQSVKKGDLLFEIDPSAYEISVQSARVALDQARQQVRSLEATVQVKEASITEAKAGVESAKGGIEAAAANVKAGQGRIDGAKAGVDAARANITAAKAILLAYQQQYDRARHLADKGAGPVAIADSLEQAVASGKAGVEAAEAGLPQANATLAQADAALTEAKANEVIARTGQGEAEARLTRAHADLAKAQADLGQPGEKNVKIQAALASLAQAELDLSWTKVTAPGDGHVTNLRVFLGNYASPGTQMLAFVDHASLRVSGYFRETQLKSIRPGDRAVITLMGYPDAEIEGEVESIGWAINPPNIATIEGTGGIVPQVQPSFDWIRLAQRVPVRVKLTSVPDEIELIAGTTASVAIEKE
jgi:multidrug resistance efflux pump